MGDKAIGIHFPAFYTVASTQRRHLEFVRSVCLNKVLFRFRNGWLNVSFILMLFCLFCNVNFLH